MMTRIDRRTTRQLHAIKTRRTGLGYRAASRKSVRKAIRSEAILIEEAKRRQANPNYGKQVYTKGSVFNWQEMSGLCRKVIPYNPKRVGIQGCGTDFAHPILADMLAHNSDEKTGRYNLLSESRVGEFTLKTVPHPYDLYDSAIHVPFNASETHQEKLMERENRRTVVEAYETHRKNGGKPSDYPGPFLTVDVFAYDKSEKLPARPMPKSSQYRKLSDGTWTHAFVLCRDVPVNGPIVRVRTSHTFPQYRDGGIKFKREFARQTICRKVPKTPATISEKQLAHWGNDASYYVRQDGEQVAIHPFKAIASEFLADFVRFYPTTKADAREWLEHVETSSPESLNYARVIYGSFKKCVHEWGASGQTFESEKTGKKTRFNWSYFYDYVCDIVARFWAVEGNQHDHKFSPVLDSFRFAVNYEKQSTTHQLRQHHSEASESVAVIRDIKPHADTTPNVRKINRESLTKRQNDVINALVSGKNWESLGISRKTFQNTVSQIKERLAHGK